MGGFTNGARVLIEATWAIKARGGMSDAIALCILRHRSSRPFVASKKRDALTHHFYVLLET